MRFFLEKFLNDGDLPMDLTRKMRKRRWMKRSPEKSSAIRGGFNKIEPHQPPPLETYTWNWGWVKAVYYRSFSAERESEKQWSHEAYHWIPEVYFYITYSPCCVGCKEPTVYQKMLPATIGYWYSTRTHLVTRTLIKTSFNWCPLKSNNNNHFL